MHRPRLPVLALALLLALVPLTHAAATSPDELALCVNMEFDPPPMLSLVPYRPTAGEPALVCVHTFLYDTHVEARLIGQHVVVTIYDSGFSWDPNPPLMSTRRLPALPAGHYILDVIVSTDTPHPGDGYPYPYLTGYAFDVVGGVPATTTPVPAVGGVGLVAGLVLLGLAGARRRRQATR